MQQPHGQQVQLMPQASQFSFIQTQIQPQISRKTSDCSISSQISTASSTSSSQHQYVYLQNQTQAQNQQAFSYNFEGQVSTNETNLTSQHAGLNPIKQETLIECSRDFHHYGKSQVAPSQNAYGQPQLDCGFQNQQADYQSQKLNHNNDNRSYELDTEYQNYTYQRGSSNQNEYQTEPSPIEQHQLHFQARGDCASYEQQQLNRNQQTISNETYQEAHYQAWYPGDNQTSCGTSNTKSIRTKASPEDTSVYHEFDTNNNNNIAQDDNYHQIQRYDSHQEYVFHQSAQLRYKFEEGNSNKDFNNQREGQFGGYSIDCHDPPTPSWQRSLQGAELANHGQTPSMAFCDSTHMDVGGSQIEIQIGPAQAIEMRSRLPVDASRVKRGRPRKRTSSSNATGSGGKGNGKLWEFIRDLLLNDQTNPNFIRWERHEDGIFKFVQSDKVAKMWGERKQNPKMTYEKLSRAMRYYYKSKVLMPVLGRRLVYKFGPNATGWMPKAVANADAQQHHALSNAKSCDKSTELNQIINQL